MSDISNQNDPADHGDSMSPSWAAGGGEGRPTQRRRRGLRIALVSLTSFVVLVGAVAIGGYVFVNHLAGSIQRIPVKFTKLESANRLATEYGGAMTVLITGRGSGPPGRCRHPRTPPAA